MKIVRDPKTNEITEFTGTEEEARKLRLPNFGSSISVFSNGKRMHHYKKPNWQPRDKE